MLRQRIGTTIGIRGGGIHRGSRRGWGNIFVLRERRAMSCLLFRPRSVLSVYSETSASHETVCLSPFPSYTLALSRPDTAHSPRASFAPVFIYLSIRLLRLFIFDYSSHFRRSYRAVSPFPRALARLPTFLFYKIDRTDETEETRSMGRNTRI